MKQKEQLNWFDRTLVAGSVLGSLLFSYFLINSEEFLSRVIPVQEGAKVVGFVEVANNDVRRRLKQSLLWYDVGTQEALYEKDSIFTGENSETYIRLSSGVGFHMGANSMVVLSQENDEFKLDLQLGSVIADVQQGAELKLVGNGEEATIKGASGEDSQVSINKTKKGQIKLASLENPFELELMSGKKTIDAKKTLRLNSQLEEEQSSQPIVLVSPPLGHTIWHSPEKPFQFSWEVLKDVSPMYLQVSKVFNFSEVIYDQKVDGNDHYASGVSSEGVYYWRIVQKNKGGANIDAVSDVHDFRLSVLTPPKMYLPKHQDLLQSQESSKGPPLANVQFIWEQKIGATRYQLQVASEPGFQSPMISEEISDTFKNQVMLPRGEYFWRVRVTAPAQGVGKWPSPYQFRVGAPGEFDEILADLRQAELDNLSLGQSAPGAPAYRQPDLAQLGEKTTERSVPLDAPDLLTKAQTTLLKFDKSLNSREPAAVKKALLNPPELTWSSVKGGVGYDIEIARNKDFTDLVERRRSEETSFTWKDAKVGQYYWRVRTHRGGETASEYSRAVQLNVGLESPILQSKIKRSFEAENPKDFLAAGPPIDFNWSPLPMTDQYKVVIVDEKSQKKVFDKIVPQPNAKIEFEKAGRYLAMVAALNSEGQRISPFSEPSEIVFEKIYKFGTPKVLYPVNGTTVVTFGSGRPDSMILDWNGVQGAKQYRLQFSMDKKFQTILVDKIVSKDQYFVNDVVPEGVIYWRVRAEYDTLYSRWTTPRYFQIQSVQN